jgi:hypothetical protein
MLTELLGHALLGGNTSMSWPMRALMTERFSMLWHSRLKRDPCLQSSSCNSDGTSSTGSTPAGFGFVGRTATKLPRSHPWFK